MCRPRAGVFKVNRKKPEGLIMRKLLATAKKETITLLRDIPGLTILFIMPLFMLIVVTLTQDKALKNLAGTKTTVLLVDNDHSALGESVEKGLLESGFFEVKKTKGSHNLSSDDVTKAVFNGDYQLGIIIPKGATDSASKRAKKLITESFVKENAFSDSAITANSRSKVIIYLNPTINESYRSSVVSSIKMLMQGAEIKIMLDNFFEVLPGQLDKQYKSTLALEMMKQLEYLKKQFMEQVKAKMGPIAAQNIDWGSAEQKRPELSQDLKLNVSKNNFPWRAENIIEIQEQYAKNARSTIRPTVVQNNVPAFTLFAMFFIVIPLSGSLITERNEGAYNRLRTLPVSYLSLLSGKVLVYSIVCLLQFVMMILVGIYLLPVMQMQSLVIGTNYFTIFVAALSSALAAVGFGLLIGTLAKSHGQAAMFGSVMVVILGILGGIFIPVYLMPAQLKFISNISPIRWGIDSFLYIFVREGNIQNIFAEIIKLIAFFGIALTLSLYTFVRRV